MKDFSTVNLRSRKVVARPTSHRATTAPSKMPPLTNSGRASPADVLTAASRNGTRQNEREHDDEASTTKQQYSLDETKIDVFVRCRGRNEQEVQENSGVVVKTDGVNGTTVELSIGSNAMGNKTYAFDKVFSPLADQQMIFDEVVRPVLDEVLRGFNCTIFAYGQTGTGKTYTMSGDISEHTLLPDDAGIIPRVLHSLFLNLSSASTSPTNGAASESSVKVSFIELYNEELRDLLSSDDKSKLKIFDGDSRRGAATVVQGIEEHYITSAKKGIQLLKTGSYKRQVAATKCNDLSSRSHTVFTVTVYTKQILASGEELLSSGKLNLVDLAGSENIGRSGAENKRAAEAGLINKSLLTLGRVINALVDRSAHIPYRESKLTRLLQDSLGGRTKTCIIATLSPARLNLEETISSLDYAFRAKNIRNKPQINKLIPKKTILKEFTVELERLKLELAATRQRNGVYMPQDTYDELNNAAESHKVLVKEQREKIEAIEYKLARKGQDLLELTSMFDDLRKDSQITTNVLDNTKSLLESKEAALAQTKRRLNEETFISQQHERTEQQLASLNRSLVTTLSQSTTDISGLHTKLGRQSELHTQNREQFSGTQRYVVDTTALLDNRLAALQVEQQGLFNALSGRMQTFIQLELEKLNQARTDLNSANTVSEQSHYQFTKQTNYSLDELSEMLLETGATKKRLNEKVEAGFTNMAEVVTRLMQGMATEVDALQEQLHSSYSSLGSDLKTVFDDMSKEIIEQRAEMQQLRNEMVDANLRYDQSQSQSVGLLSDLVDKERDLRNHENESLLQNIQRLIETSAEQQKLRIDEMAKLPVQLRSAAQTHSVAAALFADAGDQLVHRSQNFGNRLTESRNKLETRIQTDNMITANHTRTLRTMASSADDETARTVKLQAQSVEDDYEGLDTILGEIQHKTNSYFASQEQSISNLASETQHAISGIDDAVSASVDRIESLGNDFAEQIDKAREFLPHLDEDAHIRQQLAGLRRRVENSELNEYVRTGETPTRREYNYSIAAPRTNDRHRLIGRMRAAGTGDEALLSKPKSPSKQHVFIDDYGISRQQTTITSALRPGTASGVPSLRELDVNTVNVTKRSNTQSKDTALPEKSNSRNILPPRPTLKRSAGVSASAESEVPSKKRGFHHSVAVRNLSALSSAIPAGGENLTMPNLSASVGYGAAPSLGRRLRSHNRRSQPNSGRGISQSPSLFEEDSWDGQS